MLLSRQLLFTQPLSSFLDLQPAHFSLSSMCLSCGLNARYILQHPAIMKAGVHLCSHLPLITAAGNTPPAGSTAAGLLHDSALAGRLLWPGQDITLPFIKVSHLKPQQGL